MKRPENQIIVIFGASGDLTKRMLIQAFYNLYVQNLLPDKFAIIGVGRSSYSDEKFRDLMADAIKNFGKDTSPEQITNFVNNLHFYSIDSADPVAYSGLLINLNSLRENLGISGNTIFYLSTPPVLYNVIPKNLAACGLNIEEDGWKRLIIEKPFGYDYESAVKLNESLCGVWREDQIYRIDHYLGKETVQNILVTRFSNGIFEPLWNRNYVHHVEITAAEDLGVENRGGYYEGAGALRDMVQNHLLQLTGLIAMEPPSSMDSNSLRNETMKVFQSLRPIRDVHNEAIRGQYLTSTIRGKKVLGYREENGVNPESKTETYAALKFYIDNWRWGGVPFYCRTGKRLPTRVSEAVIHFRPTPHYLFAQKDNCDSCNQLVLRIQPDEGILLKFGMKTPGAGFEVQNVNMDFHYSDLSHQKIPTSYERLLIDCMQGDSTLFARADAVMSAWKFLAPVLDEWKNNNDIPVFGYPAGTWGPEKADNLIEGAGLTWRYPCKNLTDDGIYCEL
ncbi:MAG: glucose-6-phosphate dehydrogenase [Bacteroidota bacterium]|nr:glucose-6-phosphate dehydrogenase [Bacteroidota bacterium]